ncbi:MAG: SDR family NAD(P)-dependent oxidoreductase [Solirubrobacterales bacterium]
MDIDGKTILLSGGTGGLGRAIAEELAGGGAKLILSSRRENELKEIAEALPGGARRHKVIVSDLAKDGAAEKLIRDAGDIEGLVANAALPASGLLEDFSSEELGRALQVNFEAPIRMAHELAPKLAEKGEGHLVFIASLSGIAASPRSSLYSATKFGLRGFAFGLREDLHSAGVGVSVVSPGFVREAGMFADSGASAPSGLGTTTPQKVGKAVARAIRKNRSEITVAPRRQVGLAKFAGRHPEMAGKVTRGTADKIAAKVASGQSDKR